MKRFFSLALVMVLSLPLIFAQDDQELLGDIDFDALFGDEEIVVIEEGSEYKEAFKTEDVLTWFGSYRFSAQVQGLWQKEYDEWNFDYLFAADAEESAINTGMDLGFTVRPNADQRFLAKFKLDYPFMEQVNKADGTGLANLPRIRVFELFGDFDAYDKVFFRVGKQVSKWGVGYFFQPADVLSLTPVDPNNPESEREGPIMIKASIPFGTNGVELYAIAPERMDSAKEVALAARASVVLGSFELGTGLRFQHILEGKRGSPFQAVLSARGSIDPFMIFAEAALEYGSSRLFLVQEEGKVWSPFFASPADGWNVEARPDTWFPSASIGFRVSPKNTYLTVLAQYLFNGKGSTLATSELIQPAFTLLAMGKVTFSDLQNLSQHYAAANVNYSFAKDSKVSSSVFWMGNLQDGSGLVRPSLSVKVLDYATLSVHGQAVYGKPSMEAEYTTLLPRVKMGFTLDLGGGLF